MPTKKAAKPKKAARPVAEVGLRIEIAGGDESFTSRTKIEGNHASILKALLEAREKVRITAVIAMRSNRPVKARIDIRTSDTGHDLMADISPGSAMETLIEAFRISKQVDS